MDVSKFTIGRPVRIKTDDDIYDSYISAITLPDENFIYFKSGSLRITLLDKLKSESNDKGNKLDISGGTIKGSLTVNKQIYIGEARVLNYDDLYYKDGDVFDAGLLMCTGVLTSGCTDILFTIPVDKRLDNINTIKADLTRCQIRHSDGGYIANNADLSTLGNIAIRKGAGGNTLYITLTLTTASTFTNNCPVAVYIINGTVTFNK